MKSGRLFIIITKLTQSQGRTRLHLIFDQFGISFVRMKKSPTRFHLTLKSVSGTPRFVALYITFLTNELFLRYLSKPEINYFLIKDVSSKKKLYNFCYCHFSNHKKKKRMVLASDTPAPQKSYLFFSCEATFFLLGAVSVPTLLNS